MPPVAPRPAPAEAYLDALPRFTAQGAAAYQPGLDRMRTMLAALGDPHRACPVVHVAGTNGKGSTASFAAALLTASGLRTGLHTSPHLWHVSERMRVDGVPAPAAWLDAAVARLRPLFDAQCPSYFEATVVLAFLHFAETGVDAAVVEVGLGGRLDATNVVTPATSLVTALALDHTDLLGPTLAHVAREKAGIFKPGVPAFTLAQPEEAAAVLRAEAAHVGAPLEVVHDTVRLHDGTLTTPLGRYEGVEIGLTGPHQAHNAALALRGAETLLDHALPPEAVRRGLRDVRTLAGLRARLETVQARPRIVLDVAHNPHGLAAALAATTPPPGGRRTVLLGLMADKEVDAVVQLVAASGARVHPVVLDVPRALPAEVLAGRLREAGAEVGEACTVPGGVARFRATAAPDDVLLITGSFLVAAQWEQGEA
jgi:dihydrofolate synthase / folylpolyglutamate synthase